MLKFDIITIFPEVIEPYIRASIIGRAQKAKRISVHVHNLRRWTKDKHRTVDDRPFGGGPGMVMKVGPVFRAVTALKKSKAQNPKFKKRTRVVLFSASGKQFTQRVAEQYAKKYDHLIFICGRYEGVDHRVAQHIADEELSVGPYVLTGGELPALTVIDAVTRLVPGVIKPESLVEESFSFKDWRPAPERSTVRGSPEPSARGGLVQGEYPHYTRPEIFKPYAGSRGRKAAITWRVPKILLSGDHKQIIAWRASHTQKLS